jgi:hypothetical protein
LGGGGICVAGGAESRIVLAGGVVGCGAAGAGVETRAASRAVESAAAGGELAASDAAFCVESAAAGGLVAATRPFVVALTRARRAGAGLGDSESSDGVSGECVAVVFAEGARCRAGAGVGGVASDAFSPVGATIGLRLRGAFGRSASSMRRSLAASEHREPCARLC